MMFEFTRRAGTPVPLDAATFRVAQISRRQGAQAATDVSHLIDSTYDYRSPRELRWHLAERFGLAPQAVSLREAR
jgi:hypothetical protein